MKILKLNIFAISCLLIRFEYLKIYIYNYKPKASKIFSKLLPNYKNKIYSNNIYYFNMNEFLHDYAEFSKG